jgi:hypothetical protein
VRKMGREREGNDIMLRSKKDEFRREMPPMYPLKKAYMAGLIGLSWRQYVE